MDNLASRILTLVTRLSGRDEPGPGTATALDRAATEAAYRQAILRGFEVIAQGPAADRAEVDSVYQQILRLIDEVGEPRATALRRQRARKWSPETSVCRYCGERSQYHDPQLWR
ncbi:MAG: hypothetical protein HY726_01140 [Candidatus Rokubacteria bacterium]|nr:hypothetical protein [Candidatus Rokubacteria bacterium]